MSTPNIESSPVTLPPEGPRERIPTSWWVWIATGLCVVFGFLFFRHEEKGHAVKAPETAGLPVLAATKIEREDLSQKVTISGEFRPNQQVALHPKVPGFLQSISVDVGDHVTEGQSIAQLDVPELKSELEKTQAALRASEEEVARAEANYAEAHLACTRLQGVARQHPNLVAQQELDTVQAKDTTTGGAVAVAKSKVAECRAEVARVQSLVGYTSIPAPFAGVVTRRCFDPGALIQGGTAAGLPLVEIAEDKKLRFIFPVPESMVSLVKVGAPLRISVSSMGETIEAKVSRFAGKVDRATRTMSTEADIDNQECRYTPGMYASVELVVRESRDVVAAPVESIAVGAQPKVFVVTNGDLVEERAVKLGLQTPDKIEILEGLKEGDVVLVGTKSGIRPGQRIVPKLGVTAAR